MPFFKMDQQELLQAPNVEGNNYSLNEESRTEYSFPVGDWFWFPTIEEAKTYFGIVEEA